MGQKYSLSNRIVYIALIILYYAMTKIKNVILYSILGFIITMRLLITPANLTILSKLSSMRASLMRDVPPPRVQTRYLFQ